jgi:hypothetical protein
VAAPDRARRVVGSRAGARGPCRDRRARPRPWRATPGRPVPSRSRATRAWAGWSARSARTRTWPQSWAWPPSTDCRVRAARARSSPRRAAWRDPDRPGRARTRIPRRSPSASCARCTSRRSRRRCGAGESRRSLRHATRSTPCPPTRAPGSSATCCAANGDSPERCLPTMARSPSSAAYIALQRAAHRPRRLPWGLGSTPPWTAPMARASPRPRAPGSSTQRAWTRPSRPCFASSSAPDSSRMPALRVTAPLPLASRRSRCARRGARSRCSRMRASFRSHPKRHGNRGPRSSCSNPRDLELPPSCDPASRPVPTS